MTRHFLQLYLLIVVTLAAVSWGQERLWQVYGEQGSDEVAAETQSQAALLAVVAQRIESIPLTERSQFIVGLARKTGVDLELLDFHDVAGSAASRLVEGEPAFMDAANDQVWLLQRLDDAEQVLVFKYPNRSQRSALEWVLVFVFYAAIAFVIMLWLWPLSRDLTELERSTASFGDRNWHFDTKITPRSQVFPLAQSFRRMAVRIDRLIGSHKDMSNALSHEIKTPLARMRFEIEMARTATSQEKINDHLDHLDTDIVELNSFVTATLDYAILERAEVALNLADHDFRLLVPAVTDAVRRSARPAQIILCEIGSDAANVRCDAHLLETVIRNLLYNAVRYAKTQVRVSFATKRGDYVLQVDDDGPGIPEADRERIFESFVQLGTPTGVKSGFGLGLAIVKRIVEWHGGSASVMRSELGGAQFTVRWRAG